MGAEAEVPVCDLVHRLSFCGFSPRPSEAKYDVSWSQVKMFSSLPGVPLLYVVESVEEHCFSSNKLAH